MGKHEHKKNKKQDLEKTRTYKTPTNNAKVTPKKTKKTSQKTSENTKRVKVSKKGEKAKKQKKQSKHPKLKLAIKIIIILFLLLCVIGAGIIAAIFFGLFGDDFEITKEELKIGASNSKIVDQNGNLIADLSGDEKRKVITLDQMADYLPKAYVAIEDERFYEHDGVDFKRTGGAILNTIFGGDSSYGGSTITQQLVKNITKDDEASGFEGIMRKIREWSKAYQVERMISKDQILELYLNILYVGGEGNLHGVELGAEYYFNKSAKDLDLAECSFLAGINSSPNYYNPYKLYSDTDTEEKRAERIKSKCLTVLSKMKELGYVTNEEEYNAAVAKVEAGLPFQKSPSAEAASNYSYHTDALIEQVIQQVMEEKGMSREIAKNYVYSSGLTIYSTVDANIQSRVEEETKKAKYIVAGREKNKDGSMKNDHTQAAMIIIDYKTGNVLGVSGGLGEKTGSNLNRATQSTRQPGSTIKPIADIAPAIQEKVITAATMYDDVRSDFGGGYKPKNDGNIDLGYAINIRYIIAKSKNVPEVKIMKELTPTKAIDYLRNFGVTSLKKAEEVKDSKDPNAHDEYLSLAIGGLLNGISPLEMAAAYGAIANDGAYITPTFYTKVLDSNGNVVLTPNQERRQVISPQNAYIVKSILQEPVKSGTATYCAISGMDVAAKTGTTDDSKDRWLCGFTPYYAAACWYGYDTQEEVRWDFGPNPAGEIWDNVMTDIHKGLPSARFVRPEGIVEATVCKETGCLASTGCKSTYKEIFTSDNMPTKCEGHNVQTICKESGKIATEYCPETETKSFGIVVPKEKLNLWKPVNGSSKTSTAVTETCTIHKKPEEPKQNTTNTNTNKTNTNTNKANTNTNKANTNVNNTNISKPNNNTQPTPNNTNTQNKTNTNTSSTPKPNTNTNTNTNTDTNAGSAKEPDKDDKTDKTDKTTD